MVAVEAGACVVAGGAFWPQPYTASSSASVHSTFVMTRLMVIVLLVTKVEMRVNIGMSTQGSRYATIQIAVGSDKQIFKRR